MSLQNAADAKFLFKQTCLVISAIQKSSGRVIAVTCDGNRLNQTVFSSLTLTQKPHGKPKTTFFYSTTTFIYSKVCSIIGLPY